MYTRRSPRNQEILWRELGHVKPAAKPLPHIFTFTDEQIDRFARTPKEAARMKEQARLQRWRRAQN